jgi:ASC-1-like (ASCH) protein
MDERLEIDLTLGREYIKHFRNGDKTIEGRVNKGVFRRLKESDVVSFYEKRHPKNTVVCEIVERQEYPNVSST